ncbi:pilus assembly FimT family protein [Trichloromonas sp.]|uniref:pilus assembly FimT family protein n=1 Tax=Trichloromonas sp. TaxID=3069249 RepID=UPI002A4988CA|nr:GspH/FimT family pseudopilin [Trichloromonas sp.]
MNKRGFTLMELMITIGIMAILMAFATPALVQWRQSAQIKEVARDILTGLRQARDMAVTSSSTVTAVIDLDNHQLVYGGMTRTLTPQVPLEARVKVNKDDDPPWATTGTKETRFHPQGNASNTLFIRVNGDDNLEVKIEFEATGRARL